MEQLTKEKSAELGTTALINNALIDEVPELNNYHLDKICNVLDKLSIDQILRALIADCDAEEIVTLLAINEDIKIADKPIKEIIVVAEDDTETHYKSNS